MGLRRVLLPFCSELDSWLRYKISLVPGAIAVNILFLQADNRLCVRGSFGRKLQGWNKVFSCGIKTEMFPASSVQVKGAK